ncbi:MAG: hypothetical protein ACLFV3_01475 [Phycisphaeraceae bacterium]
MRRVMLLILCLAAAPPLELPGHLADYSDKWTAVFNERHEASDKLELEVSESLERTNVRVEWAEGS